MSDRYNPRVIETGRVSGRPQRQSLPRPGGLPDPPDNPEFEELPEAAQALFARRFETGVKLTEARNTFATVQVRMAWFGWVRRCHQNRLREREEDRHDRVQRNAILEQNRRRVR